MISVESVGKRYGEQTVLEGVSLSIERGTLTALIGANGAGKSTLLSILGRMDTGEGRVTIDGRPLPEYSGPELARKLSTLRQTTNIMARLTVRELVGFGRYPHSGARLTEADRAAVEAAIQRVEMDRYADRHIDQLSGGERQRAFIAMVLAQDTDYILLDEPLNNLDMKHAAQIMRLMRALVDEAGKTVVIVLHDINFAARYADRLAALRNGRLVAAGPPAEVMTPELIGRVFDMDVNIRMLDGRPLCLYY